MKLIELLSEASTDDLERIAHEHARSEEQMSRPSLLHTIESVIRSYRFIQEFLFNRQPPAFAMVTLLLDAPELSLSTAGFREAVLEETDRISRAIESGEILRRNDQLRVYRRVLYQARSNDLQIDSTEWGILGVLRQELEITQVEHFLIEHHPDLREFWQQDGAFARELHALRSAGVAFVRQGRTVLPEDLAAVSRQVLGMDMSRAAARRVFLHLSGQELYHALARISAPTSGSKEEKVDRLLTHMAQPRAVLRELGLEALRRVCRDTGAPTSGSKDDLVARIAAHVGSGRDIAPQDSSPSVDIVDEPRHLDEPRFARLFSLLRGHQLAAILGEFELRRWGTKEFQIRGLWEARRSENTLLSCLSNLELEAMLHRVGLKASGAKPERIARLLEHFTHAGAGGDDEQETEHFSATCEPDGTLANPS